MLCGHFAPNVHKLYTNKVFLIDTCFHNPKKQFTETHDTMRTNPSSVPMSNKRLSGSNTELVTDSLFLVSLVPLRSAKYV